MVNQKLIFKDLTRSEQEDLLSISIYNIQLLDKVSVELLVDVFNRDHSFFEKIKDFEECINFTEEDKVKFINGLTKQSLASLAQNRCARIILNIGMHEIYLHSDIELVNGDICNEIIAIMPFLEKEITGDEFSTIIDRTIRKTYNPNVIRYIFNNWYKYFTNEDVKVAIKRILFEMKLE